jgi:hypothetical protein
MPNTGPSNPGAISLYIYLDYNDDTEDDVNNASNIYPNNVINGSTPVSPDTFFNSVIPTTSSSLNGVGGTKFWQRVFCPTRANFLTLQYTMSNAQLAGVEQQQQVQIDASIIWCRKGGRLSQI